MLGSSPEASGCGLVPGGKGGVSFWPQITALPPPLKQFSLEQMLSGRREGGPLLSGTE